MIDMWVIYLLTRIDEIKHYMSDLWIFPLLFWAAVLYAVVFIFWHLVDVATTDKSGYKEAEKATDAINIKWRIKHIRTGIILSVITGCIYALASLLYVLIPTRNEAAVIYIVPKVFNSDFVQKDMPAESKEMYGLAKQWLKDAVQKHGETKPVPAIKPDVPKPVESVKPQEPAKPESGKSDMKELFDKSLEFGKAYAKEEASKLIESKVSK